MARAEGQEKRRLMSEIGPANTGGVGSGTSLTAGDILPGQVDSVRVPDCGGTNDARVFVRAS